MQVERWINLLAAPGVLAIVALLFKYFLLSAPERLEERSKKNDEVNLRATRWEAEWKACEQSKIEQHASDEQKRAELLAVAELRQRRNDRLSWVYDDLRGAARRLCLAVREGRVADASALSEIEAMPDAAAVMAAVQ